MTLLAQQDDGATTQRLVFWVVVLIIVVIAFGAALMLLRRTLDAEEDDIGEGLMLDDLRRLRDTGEITHEEFQRALDAMAQRARQIPGTEDDKITRL